MPSDSHRRDRLRKLANVRAKHIVKNTQPTTSAAAAGNQVVSPAQPTSSDAQVVPHPPPSATPAAGNQVVSPAQPTSSDAKVVSQPPPSPTPAADAQVVSSAPPPPPPSAAADAQVVSSAPPPPPPSATADADNHSDNKPVLTFRIDLQVGGHDLVTNSSLKFQKKRRYALVGPSGSGKSTLLAAISTGTIPIAKDLFVYHLADGVKESDLSVLDAVMGNKYTEKKSELEKIIENLQSEDDKEPYRRLLDKFGPKAYHHVCEVLAGFGFNSYMLHSKTRGLSESWRMKINLAKAIYHRPDILLLENPTKYLDFDACEWLEKQLKELESIQVIISNSERLLLNVCTDVIEISVQDKIIVEHYDTGYKEYQLEKSEEIAKFATTSTPCDNKFSFEDFAGEIPTGGNLVHWSNVECVHKNQTVFKRLSLDINFGSKIALVGGSGKSVLLKFLARTLLGLNGNTIYMSGIRIETFEQHSVGMLDQENSGIQYMKSCNQRTLELHLIASASNFGLSEQMLKQKIKTLSDCQRTRLVFSTMAVQKPHLLLLDEPTSHLDYDAIGCLAEGLKKWDGAFVIAGHDFRLISLIAPEIWVCGKQGITKRTCDITICRNEMIEEAADKRSVVRPPWTAGLFPLFSIGSYRNVSMPFISYLKYIDHQHNCSIEPTVSLERFKIRRYMTAFAPCNSLEEGFLMIPGEKMPGKRYQVSTEAGKKVASSLLEPLWVLENVGLCFSDFSKKNIFVTPSGEVKFRGVQLLKFSDDQLLRNLSSAISILENLFERDGTTPEDIVYLLNLMKNHPEKREIFHSNASLVPLSNYGDFYMKMFGCLHDKIEPSLRESILEGLPHLDDFEVLVQGNDILKTHFDHDGGNKYITPAPPLPAGQQSLTAWQQKKFNLDRARKLSTYLRNRFSHRMEFYGRLCRYLPDMADLAVLVRLPRVNCYLQEKLFDAGETKDLMLHNLIK